MKLSRLLLLGSLGANAVLVAVLALRPDSPGGGAHGSSAPAPVISPPGAVSAADPRDSTLQAALASGDDAALAAAGVSPEIRRALAIGRAFDKMQKRIQELRPHSPDDEKYWRRSGLRPDVMTKEARKELDSAQREFSEALQAATGNDIDSLFDGENSRYSFLPTAKREQLRQIARDYAEMRSQVVNDQEGVPLPADREKLRLLRLEEEHDINAALTPEQREQYDLRASQSAINVRNRYGDVIQSEEEYRKIYALQKAFDDQYSNIETFIGGLPSDAARARREAGEKLQDDIRAALNPDELAAFQRTNDQDYKAASSVARRLNLPANAADAVLASRESYAAQSMAINANATLSNDERRNQLLALAASAQNDLQKALGVDGAQAYAQRSQWMNMLKNGSAFSTDPKDAASGSRPIGATIFPVQPPRSPVPATITPATKG